MRGIDTDVPRDKLLAACLAAVAVICVLDSVTPAGVVVGIFLLIPVIASAYSDRPRDVWLTWGAATAGFLGAILFGKGSSSPSAVWVPNRVFTTLTLAGGLVGALRLQALRLEALRSRDQALRDRELSMLLHTLLAHELRSPLAMAGQALQYVRGAAAGGAPPDEELLRPIHARLERSLDTVDQVLELALTRLQGRSVEHPFTPEEVARALEAGARAFREEAELRGGRLDLRRSVSGNGAILLDLMVLRQSVALVLGEALRRGGREPVSVSLAVSESAVSVDVLASLKGTPPDLSAEIELFAGMLRAAGGDLTSSSGSDTWALHLHVPARRAHA